MLFEEHTVYQKTHGQRVVSYAEAAKAPIQSMSWVGVQPAIRKQRPAASVTSRPIPSVSRSVGTTTRVADVKKPVATAKSSPPKKDPKSSKHSSPTVSPVRESDAAYFTVKHTTGNVRRIPILQMCKSPQFSLKLLF